MSTLSIRIEEKTKKAADKTLKSLGLDMSSAVKLFLNQVVIEQGIPFKPSRSPREIREEYDKEVAWALKHGKRYKDTSKMFKDLMKEID